MNVEILFQIAAVGITVAVLTQVLQRSERPEHALLVTVAGLVLVLLLVVKEVGGLFESVKSIFGL